MTRSSCSSPRSLHNPHALSIHQAIWRALGQLHHPQALVDRYGEVTQHAVFYLDPHVCTRCRYRSTELLWQCPHCHDWNTFVEERIAPAQEATEVEVMTRTRSRATVRQIRSTCALVFSARPVCPDHVIRAGGFFLRRHLGGQALHRRGVAEPSILEPGELRGRRTYRGHDAVEVAGVTGFVQQAARQRRQEVNRR